MSADFETLVWETIQELWPLPHGTLASEAIYDHLIKKGVEVPEGAMAQALEGLRIDRSIQAYRPLGGEAITMHGNMVITDVASRRF